MKKPSEVELLAMVMAWNCRTLCATIVQTDWKDDAVYSKGDRVFWRKRARAFLRALRGGR